MSKLPHNRTWYTKKLSELAKKCAKERDKYICQKCGKECVGADAHGSHVLNVGTHKNMELDPSNIKCLCYYHHMNWWHKDVMYASKWFKGKFPERWVYLQEISKLKLKLSTVELAELYDKVRGKNWKVYGTEYAKLIESKIKGGTE